MRSKLEYRPGTDLIDPSDVQGSIDRLLAFHRATFGSAVMEAEGGDGGNGGEGGEGGSGGTGGEPNPDDKSGGDTGADDKSKAGKEGEEGDLYTNPEKAKAEIARLRREAAADRTNAKTKAAEDATKALTDRLLEALGQKPGAKAPTADELASQLSKATDEGREARVELAVFKAAGKHQGDPNALLDSRSFLAEVKGLDPAAADFQSKIDAAIKTAVDANPKLKAVLGTGKSAVDHAAGNGEKKTPTSLDAAVQGAYTGK